MDVSIIWRVVQGLIVIAAAMKIWQNQKTCFFVTDCKWWKRILPDKRSNFPWHPQWLSPIPQPVLHFLLSLPFLFSSFSLHLSPSLPFLEWCKPLICLYFVFTLRAVIGGNVVASCDIWRQLAAGGPAETMEIMRDVYFEWCGLGVRVKPISRGGGSRPPLVFAESEQIGHQADN